MVPRSPDSPRVTSAASDVLSSRGSKVGRLLGECQRPRRVPFTLSPGLFNAAHPGSGPVERPTRQRAEASEEHASRVPPLRGSGPHNHRVSLDADPRQGILRTGTRPPQRSRSGLRGLAGRAWAGPRKPGLTPGAVCSERPGDLLRGDRWQHARALEHSEGSHSALPGVPVQPIPEALPFRTEQFGDPTPLGPRHRPPNSPDAFPVSLTLGLPSSHGPSWHVRRAARASAHISAPLPPPAACLLDEEPPGAAPGRCPAPRTALSRHLLNGRTSARRSLQASS